MLKRELQELRSIASDLDGHIDRGVPYSLTFYNTEQGIEPITQAQKESLEKYLAYHFRDIWGQWIQLESDRIRLLIGDKLKHN